MKRHSILIALILCILTFTGCGKTTDNIEEIPSSDESQPTEEEDIAEATISLRIVDGAATGELVLAGESAGDVYTLNVAEIPVYLDEKLADASILEDGMMAEIAYSGEVMETYPAQLGNVSSISVYSLGSEKNPYGTFYDLCGLYLQILNDLWDKDSGLNGGAASVSVDLSKAPGELTEGEKAAITWIFACEHQVEGLNLTADELAEQEYLTEVDMEYTSEDDHKIYEWKDGVLFTITADYEEGESYSLPVLKFNAEKWRSPLGAYFFSGCEAVWPQAGSWSSYSIESEMIS